MKVSLGSCLLVVLLGVAGCSNSSAPQPPQNRPKQAAQPVAPTGENMAHANPAETTAEPSKSPAETPATVPTDASVEATEATPLELVRREVQFEYDQVKYAIFAPADAKLRITQSPIDVHAGPHFHMSIGFGRFDLSTIARTTDSLNETKILSQTPDVVIVRKQVFKSLDDLTPVDSVVFFMNRTLGHRDFTFTVAERDYTSPSSREVHAFTLAECKGMIRAAERMELAETLPEDPAAILERLDATIRRDDDGKVRSAFLSVIRTTDATLLLLKNFPSLVQLDAKMIDMRDSTLASVLAELPNLESLDLRDADIVGETIPDLKGQPRLKRLRLGGDHLNSLTDAGWKRLGEAQTLEELSIGSPKLTGTLLARLAVLPNLTELRLTKIYYESADPSQASGLAHLAKFPKLQSLNISYLYALTDDGLKGVAAITALRELSIEQCGTITSAGIAPLTALKNLTKLDLTQTEVDDAVVAPLSQMKSLRALRIRRTKITDAGFEKLKAALPDCEIDYK